MITLESVTAERLQVTITTPGDPTGVLPSFAIGQGTDPSAWVTGTWASPWDSTTGQITANTPVIGASQPLPITTAPGEWRLWARWTVAGETPVRVAAIVRVV